MLAEEERQRRKQEEEVRESKAFLETFHQIHEESLRQRDHWIRARCLDPGCGHFGAVRLPHGTSADALISKLYCSQCGSKRFEAVEWSPNEPEAS
jgi:hypothetical protein